MLQDLSARLGLVQYASGHGVRRTGSGLDRQFSAMMLFGPRAGWSCCCGTHSGSNKPSILAVCVGRWLSVGTLMFLIRLIDRVLPGMDAPSRDPQRLESQSAPSHLVDWLSPFA